MLKKILNRFISLVRTSYTLSFIPNPVKRVDGVQNINQIVIPENYSLENATLAELYEQSHTIHHLLDLIDGGTNMHLAVAHVALPIAGAGAIGVAVTAGLGATSCICLPVGIGIYWGMVSYWVSSCNYTIFTVPAKLQGLLNEVNKKISEKLQSSEPSTKEGMGSPLDQFSSDTTYFPDIFNNTITDLFPNAIGDSLNTIIGFAGIVEFGSIGDVLTSLFYIILTLPVGFNTSSSVDKEGAVGAIIESNLFTFNLPGMVPGFDTISSSAAEAFSLSIQAISLIVFFGYAINGLRFPSMLLPGGTPAIISPFIIIIETVSYLARPVSLGMRLFANMFAGHTLVKIIMSFLWIFLSSGFTALIALPVFALMIAITMLEIGIGFLQAYVFGVLSNMYLVEVTAISDH